MFKHSLIIFMVALICSQAVHTPAHASDCYPEIFLKHIGYQDILSATGDSVSKLAELGNERRCAYKSQLSSCMIEAQRKIKAYQALKPPADQSEAEVFDAVEAILQMLSSTTWDYTSMPGRLYGATIKDVKPQVEHLGTALQIDELPLQDKKFIEVLTEICSLGRMSDEEFSVEFRSELSEQAEKLRKKSSQEAEELRKKTLLREKELAAARVEQEKAKREMLRQACEEEKSQRESMIAMRRAGSTSESLSAQEKELNEMRRQANSKHLQDPSLSGDITPGSLRPGKSFPEKCREIGVALPN